MIAVLGSHMVFFYPQPLATILDKTLYYYIIMLKKTRKREKQGQDSDRDRCGKLFGDSIDVSKQERQAKQTLRNALFTKRISCGRVYNLITR